MSLAALFAAERAKKAPSAVATPVSTPTPPPVAEDPYAKMQPPPEALKAAMEKMMAASRGGHRGDIVPRSYEYEP